MSILDEFHRDDTRILDRLVDGELGPRERRELLAALDDEPGAWRRCALAFLESQDWRLQLSRAAAEPLVAPASRPAKATPTGQRNRWTAWLSIAAGLLLAFGIGRQFPAASLFSPSPMVPQDAEVAAPVGEDFADPWQTLTLTPLGGQTGQAPIQVRVHADSEKLVAGRTASTALGQLERDGWQVKRQHGWLPIQLPDGSGAVVPIEEFDIRSPELVQF